jgi:hypothetical protein
MVERDAGLFDAAQVHGRHIMLARAAHMVRSEQASLGGSDERGS